MDHVFTLRAIIEEARYHFEKVYCCFVDFRKAFDFVPRMALLQKLREIEISDMMLTAIMHLYEKVIGRFKTSEGFSVSI